MMSINSNNNRFDSEFVKRCKKVLKPLVEKWRLLRCEKCNKWAEENREKARNSVRRFFKTEKGKDLAIKSSLIRCKRLKKACIGLGKEEEEKIREFYKNCPIGFEVDHIIPISRKGKHRLNNLQYLTREENLKKGHSIIKSLK